MWYGIFRTVKHNGHAELKELCVDALSGKYLVFKDKLKAEEKVKEIDKIEFWVYSVDALTPFDEFYYGGY